MKKNTYTILLALVFSLFFLWAISSNLLPTMIRQLMKTCELNTFEASFTETAYWLAYFIFPIPIAMFMKRYSYKAGIIFGLLLAAVGGLLFFPAAILGLSLHLLHYRYRNVFSGDSRQSLCNRVGSSRNGSAPIESGAILQWSGRFYRSDVSEQADSKRHPLYTRNASC